MQHTEENTVRSPQRSAPTTTRTNAVGIFQIAAFVCSEFWLFNQIHSLQKRVKRGICKLLLTVVYGQTHTWCMFEKDWVSKGLKAFLITQPRYTGGAFHFSVS